MKASKTRNEQEEVNIEDMLREQHLPAFRLACKLMGNAHDAEDVLQNAMAKAYKYRASYQGKVPFAAWFKRILINESITYRKKGEKMPKSSSSGCMDQVASPVEAPAVETGEVRDRILREFDNLSRVQRVVMTLHVVEGMSISDIAMQMDSPKKTVKTYLYRARRRLRTLFKDFFEKGEF